LKYSFEKLDVYVKAKGVSEEDLRAREEIARRAAISLTNNIAEGHGRFHYQESIRFFRHSRGSLQELIDDINICMPVSTR
jgi:four helix bundle protein